MSCILLVEDTPANAKLAGDILALNGHQVLHAANATDGMALAREHLPELIIMDIQLPGMDGLTATKLLKADEATGHVPVMALTAHAMRGDEDRIIAAGCDAYLAKPIHYKDLLALVNELLEES